MYKEKKYIFGAGNNGLKAYEELKDKYEIIGFLDNDSNKWEKTMIDGIKIYSPKMLDGTFENILIVSNSNQIVYQLNQLGIKEYTFYPSLLLAKEQRFTDRELCKQIDEASKRVLTKLSNIVPENLMISSYSKKYLNTKNHRSMYVYSRILYTVLSENKDAKTILDYGGGTGLLSLLALECGFEEVYYNDIYEVSCIDADIISKSMGYRVKKRICGDFTEVMDFCKDNKVYFDILVSYDVLEHIYNLNLFYRDLKQVLNDKGISCMETGSNSYNQKLVYQLTNTHIICEFKEREKTYGHKDRDSVESYFKMRLRFIQEYVKVNHLDLNPCEELALAYLTRGKRYDDVSQAVENYVHSKILPELDTFFEYNACDPITGNWAEHIIDFESLEDFLRNNQYEVTLLFNGEPEESNTVQVLTKLTQHHIREERTLHE